MPHQRVFGENCMIRLELILESTNKNIIGQMFPEVFKSRSRGEILPYTMCQRHGISILKQN